MNVVMFTEVRVYKVKGHFYADNSFAKIVKRYNDSFGKVSITTRIINENEVRDGYIQIDKCCDIFYNIGSISSFLLKKTSRAVKECLNSADLVIMRLPSLISFKVYRLIRKSPKKYLAEVVGCAWDAYWNHGFVGKLIALPMYILTKKIVKEADYCIYVTNDFLQRRYPNNNFSVGISDVDIESVDKPKKYDSFDSNNFTIMTAAALNVKYKGQRYVIRAMKELKKKHNIDTTYYLAGKGSDYQLKKLSKKLKLEKNVIFLGMLSRRKIDEYMRKIDFYIQPSLQEGLPRSVVEAMSHGAVCFGTRIAGIPELLSEKQLFDKKSVKSIVNTILNAVKNDNFDEISEQNINKAKEFLSSELDIRRRRFYKKILADCLEGKGRTK